MTERTTLDWGSLEPDDLDQVEDALDRWEAAFQDGQQLAGADVCDDPKLIAFVEERIDDLRRVATFFVSDESSASSPSSPPRIGPIRIVQSISRGIICDVYHGKQHDPSRDVAVKVLHRDGDNPSIVRGFKREVGILAKLDHPGIAKVYFAGTDANEGRALLYFAMEYVDGPKLTKYAEKHSLSIEQRVELFIQVCEAIGHAHQSGVIHRDLKPSNILTTKDGQPKILDFGIAKWTEPSRSLHSQYGVGTPGYMSPEQFAREDRQDIRSDIYSLGVIFYQLLCGELPYADPVDSIVNAAKAVASGKIVRLETRFPRCPRDLAAITHKCLQQAPVDRYQSVQALAEDLSKFLEGDAVDARPLPLPETARRWVAKHRSVTTIGLFAFFCFACGGIASLVFWRRAVNIAQNLASTVVELEQSRTSVEIARDELSEELTLRRRSAFNHMLANADRNWQASPSLVRDGLDEAATSGLGPKSFAWEVQMHRTQRVIREIQAHHSVVVDIAYLADRHQLATVGQTGVMKVWDLNTGDSVWARELGITDVTSCDVHPSGDRILVVDVDELVMIDAADSSTLRRVSAPPGDVRAASFSPSGDLIVAWGKTNTLSVWDADLGEVVRVLTAPSQGVLAAAVNVDSSAIMAIGANGEFATWDLDSGEMRPGQNAWKPRVGLAAISRDFARFALARVHGNLRIYDSGGDDLPCQVTSRGERFDVISFSPDGRWLLSGNRQRVVARSAESIWRKQWSRNVGAITTSIDFSGSGATYAMGLRDGRVQHCLLAAPPLSQVLARGLVSPRSISLAPDGSRAVVAGGSVVEFDLTSGQSLRKFADAGAACVDTVWHPDGRLFVAAGKKRQLLQAGPGCVDWDVVLASDHAARAVAVDEAREKLVVGFAKGQVVMADARSGQLLLEVERHRSNVTSLTLHQATGMFACGCEDGEITLWDTDGQLISRYTAHTRPISGLAFSCDGTLLLSASHDRSVGRYHIESERQLRPIRISRERIFAVAISPDGETIAVAGADRDISLCDAVTGELQAMLQGHTDTVTDLVFTADDRALLSISLDGTLRRWRSSLPLDSVGLAGTP